MNFDSQETIPSVYSPAYVLLLSLIQEIFFQTSHYCVIAGFTMSIQPALKY